MEAKDTVISWEKIRMVLQEQDRMGQRNNMFRLESIAQAQAEITWKAREPEITETRREIVEWIKGYRKGHCYHITIEDLDRRFGCPFERIRSYPGCFEDCPDTDMCPVEGMGIDDR